ncbi:unnamed protein product, partial [Cuscuta epithymum]
MQQIASELALAQNPVS